VEPLVCCVALTLILLLALAVDALSRIAPIWLIVESLYFLRVLIRVAVLILVAVLISGCLSLWLSHFTRPRIVLTAGHKKPLIRPFFGFCI
jgi:hypothetical protein